MKRKLLLSLIMYTFYSSAIVLSLNGAHWLGDLINTLSVNGYTIPELSVIRFILIVTPILMTFAFLLLMYLNSKKTK